MTKVSEKVETKKVAENGNVKTDATAQVNASEAQNPKPEKVSIEQLKKSLEERIAEFQRKSELIEKRTLFQLKQDTLLDVMKRMGSDFDAELESNDFKLVLRNSNHREDVISIANNDLIYEFLRMLSLKIREKVQNLENEILQ